jgi:hypothetical protein
VADQPKKKPEKNKTMNTERSNRKASKQKPGDYRSPKKEWRGSHTRGTDLDGLQKVLMGQGLVRNISSTVDGSIQGRWTMPQTVHQPYDPATARENRRLYPHLFADR